MRTEAEKKYYRDHPEYRERAKLSMVDDIIEKLGVTETFDGPVSLTFINNDRDCCETCKLPRIAEVRGVPSDFLLEIVKEWKENKEKQNDNL
jgi:hypothetical protein